MSTLTGQLLIAMPQMEDPRFEHSVVFLFSHSAEEGAMGVIINKPTTLSVKQIFPKASGLTAPGDMV